MPLQRLQQETSSTEFLEWCEYMQEDLKVVQRQEFYLARIAALIYAAATHKATPLKDFIFDFAPGPQPSEENIDDEEKRQRHIQRSKANWAAIVGQPPKKPPPKKRK
jgi:hypothetical protein